MSRSRIAVVCLTFAAAVVSGSCADSTAPPTATIEVTPGTTTLVSLGETVQLTAVFKDVAGTVVPGTQFTWSTQDALVATVDPTGLVRAVGNGESAITATSGEIQGAAALTVAVAVSTVEVTPASVALTAIGQTVQFNAVAKDANGNPINGVTFTWLSSNPAIATIDANGFATGVGLGTVTVTAVAGGVQSTANLSVSAAGTGTNTLRVIANVNANDMGGGLYTTDFDVTVTDVAAAPVSGAAVVFENSVLGPTMPIQCFESPAGTGIYRANTASFPGGEYQLSVSTASDTVGGVIVRGPGTFTITTPQANDTIPAAQPLTVLWTQPSQAEGAEIETRDLNRLSLPDTASYMIEAVDNPVNVLQRIRVFRFNGVDIAGGLVGSRLEIKIRAEVEPVVVQ